MTAPERITPVRRDPDYRLLDADEVLEIAARILTGPRRQEAMWDLERMAREAPEGQEKGEEDEDPFWLLKLEMENEDLEDEVDRLERELRELRTVGKKASPESVPALQRIAEQVQEYGGLARAPGWLLEEIDRALESVRGEG